MEQSKILLELQNIRENMIDKDAYHGYGQMDALIKKLETEDLQEQEFKKLNKPDVIGSAEYRCPNPRINSFTGRCESCGKWHTLEADL